LPQHRWSGKALPQSAGRWTGKSRLRISSCANFTQGSIASRTGWRKQMLLLRRHA